MIALYLAILILVLCGLRERRTMDAWLSRDDSNAVKGVFILMVFVAHTFDYTFKGTSWELNFIDQIALSVRGLFGQLIVVMFFFFSGYGVSESIREKKEYVRTMPKNRILGTLLNFDIAVLVFALFTFVYTGSFPYAKLVPAFVGWDSVGNSNWYIFSILLCYLVVYIVAMTCKKIGIVTLMVLIAVTQVLSLVRPNYWYNTMLAFPLGMLISERRVWALSVLDKHFSKGFMVCVTLFSVIYCFRYDWHGFRYNALSVCFAMLIIIIMHKVRVENKFLVWCGRKLFPLYIYQRLSMLVVLWIVGQEFASANALIFSVMSFAVTLIIARIYRPVRLP